MTIKYPYNCPECGSKSVSPSLERLTSSIKYDGSVYEVVAEDCPVSKCGNCNEIFYTNGTHHSIDVAARNSLGILCGAQILANRKLLGLKQSELAQHLRVSVESISRWENSRVMQSRSSDLLMRLFFELPIVRHYSEKCTTDLQVGKVVNLGRQYSWSGSIAKAPLASWGQANYPDSGVVVSSDENPLKLVS